MMRSIFLILLLVCGMFWRYGDPKHIPSFAGPYRVIGRRVWNTSLEFQSSRHFTVWGRFTSPRPGQKQYTWGGVLMLTTLSDDVKIQVRMSVWANNQWKRNAFIFKFEQACTALFAHARFLPAMILKPHEMKCPVMPIGSREIKNQTFVADFPHFPVMPYGRYLFDMVFNAPDNKSGVLVADIEIVPKI